MPDCSRLLHAHIPWADFEPGEFRQAPCNICGSFRFSTLASLVLNSHEFFIVECDDCGLVWRNPLPGDSFLSALYGQEYFDIAGSCPSLSGQVGIQDSMAQDKAFRDSISARVVQSWVDLGILPRSRAGRPNRLLEIGGGTGHLQRAAADRGWQTMGLESSAYGIAQATAAGVPVVVFPLKEFCAQAEHRRNPFDVVVFYDFLEHVTDPGQTIRLVRQVLARDGTLILRVPNTQRCPTLHLIDHIWHFSKRSLWALLRKEELTVLHAHRSGRCPAGSGGVLENMTVFARKAASGDFPEIELATNPLGL